MSVLATKILQTMAYPLGLAVTILVLSLLLSFRYRRMARIGMTLAILILWICSIAPTAHWMVGSLERQYPPLPLAEIPSAPMAIILGGGINPQFAPRPAPDLNSASDRILLGARLYRAGKVRTLLISGGNQAWYPSAPPEAEAIRWLLNLLGVPDSAIVLEPDSRTTWQNAANTARLMQGLGFDHALLVTSASHMPRALATFRKAGVDVIPASAEMNTVDIAGYTLLSLLPSVSHLEATTMAIKERLGILVYRLRGQA